MVSPVHVLNSTVSYRRISQLDDNSGTCGATVTGAEIVGYTFIIMGMLFVLLSLLFNHLGVSESRRQNYNDAVRYLDIAVRMSMVATVFFGLSAIIFITSVIIRIIK